MPSSVLSIKEQGYIVFYHGTSALFRKPNLDFFKDGGDFGKGFYLTKSYSMAKKWAKIQMYRKGTPRGYILAFGISLSLLNSCKMKKFSGISEEWLHTIISCRDLWTRRNPCPTYIVNLSNYDMVYGPTADANTSQVLMAYVRSLGFGYHKTINEVIDSLEVDKLSYQYCVKSSNLLNSLKYLGNEVVL